MINPIYSLVVVHVVALMTLKYRRKSMKTNISLIIIIIILLFACIITFSFIMDKINANQAYDRINNLLSPSLNRYELISTYAFEDSYNNLLIHIYSDMNFSKIDTDTLYRTIDDISHDFVDAVNSAHREEYKTGIRNHEDLVFMPKVIAIAEDGTYYFDGYNLNFPDGSIFTGEELTPTDEEYEKAKIAKYLDMEIASRLIDSNYDWEYLIKNEVFDEACVKYNKKIGQIIIIWDEYSSNYDEIIQKYETNKDKKPSTNP